jgi:hypothetical protein
MIECKQQSCTLHAVGVQQPKRVQSVHTQPAHVVACFQHSIHEVQSVGVDCRNGGAGHVWARRKCQEKVTTRSANDRCGGMRVDVTHPIGLGKPRQGKHVQEQEPLEQVLHHTSTLQPPKQDLGEPARTSLQHPTHPCR